MKFKNTILRAAFLMLMVLTISSSLFAQRRHYNNRGWGYNYYGYNYRPSRPVISVNIGRPYHYYSRPVYRHSPAYIHFGPAFGMRINALPFGYYPFYIGSNPYYYYNGVYYRSHNGGGYQVIAPPLGATVKHLPAGAKATVIDGVKYYELGGTYYQEEITEKNKLRYKVVGTDGVLNTNAGPTETINEDDASPVPLKDSITAAAPAQNEIKIPETGTRVDQLPPGARTIVIKKEKYYLSPTGVYYQEVIEGDKIRYEVTGNSEAEK